MSRQLVHVGRVFGIFPSEPCHIIGIEVTGSIFGSGNTLTYVNPDNPNERIATKASTIEIEHARYNKALPESKCAVKSHCASECPEPGWQVFVPENQSRGAVRRPIKTWPRPQAPTVRSRGYVGLWSSD